MPIPKNHHVIPLPLPVELWEQVKREAAKELISSTQYIRRTVLRAVNEKKEE